jgi:hypothetical protein
MHGVHMAIRALQSDGYLRETFRVPSTEAFL